uniref:protein LYRIC-like n=1 Tax=Semicossyphus pulcher TaxID=241346 RepID=UPI0037E73EC9
MEQWLDAASQQVESITNRLNELLSKGLGLLHSELGVNLGLKPELIPTWVILSAACTGVVLMVGLWASVCRAVFKKRPAVRPVDNSFGLKRGVVNSKLIKFDEPKKKRKKADKKAQPNGRAVTEPHEEAIMSKESVPYHHSPPPEAKAEKVTELKKSKKKVNHAVKEAKTMTIDGKEPEEGTWETKVSNKEKREQRKKDKSSSDGIASPGGGYIPVSTPPEQPKATAPSSQKKKKVNSSEAAAPGMTDVAVKVPAHIVALKMDPWTSSRETASLWRAEIEESWTVIEKRMPTSEQNLSLPGLSSSTAKSQAMMELLWLSQSQVDDEWSGLNGVSVNHSSDWNAPSEAWGNYEEPTPDSHPAQEQTLFDPTTVNVLVGAADNDEDEKDKAETAADGAAKTKKKKKKKKKSDEGEEAGVQIKGEELEKDVTPAATVKKEPLRENIAAIQPVKAADVESRVKQSVMDNFSKKKPLTQVPQKQSDGEPTANRNNLPASKQQKKPEESQAAKQAKKKRARRET